ncbi:hypothetical protein AUC70_15110 [Methyloceanibacter stevinii]|uniref:Potassium channel domain-containing protein n=1 Tax=Methyloceanibacter stevinii TaxID=1774970 RepID=A0A1E3VSU9_9HYPH|nr:ion channel [Methyloceanibacter stevinii]ODR96585.1 hypothetical protein AUC70_15110 [Methyloceanibacter stevinii]
MRLKKVPNFGVLLLILCLLIVVAPIATSPATAFGIELLFNVVFIAGAYWLARGDSTRWVYLCLTLAALITRWGALLTGAQWLQVTSATVTLAWFALSIALIFGELARRRDVDANTIMGAVVAYLLLAVAFAYLYGIIEHIQPGSFAGLPANTDRAHLGDALIYFSLVTLTTVGCGDIVAVSGPARPLAGLEAACGTLYVAVMIARLVAIEVAARIRGEDGR